jgi:eukaryotic-like serine/threonine-protein kinase
MKQIGHYNVHEVIGEGHIGIVYRATDKRDGRTVALKVLLADSPVSDARTYFQNEVDVLSRLEHPHIPACLSFSDIEPAYLTLQWIDGVDSATLLEQLPVTEFISSENIVSWGAQICDALAYLHNHTPPIAFRDLKPTHIMIDQANHAWLVDFNLAKILPPEKTILNADLIGTEGFSAPEQYKGVVSPLVDLYALGASLHHLATRINPRSERRFTYAPPRSVNSQIPKRLAAVLMCALAYEPEDRFPSAEAMKAALLDSL